MIASELRTLLNELVEAGVEIQNARKADSESNRVKLLGCLYRGELRLRAARQWAREKLIRNLGKRAVKNR